MVDLENRVAIYIDFDNIVISRYNQLHGSNQFAKDRARNYLASHSRADPSISIRIEQSTVDIGAVLDYASSFGSVVISRAYADWSATINASYQKQLIGRAVDLTQLFPTAGYTKNGADIRLAVDVVEDLFRLPDLTHIIIVAGDSDYIALAQKCKRLGRYVVGIGVAGSTSVSLAAACDEFAIYDALPGLEVETPAMIETPQTPSSGDQDVAATAHPSWTVDTPEETQPGATPGGSPDDFGVVAHTEQTEDPQDLATDLLVRAMRLVRAKSDSDWLYASSVKPQMRRLDPSFHEVGLGYSTFSDFLRSRDSIVELDEGSPLNARVLRLREG